MDYEKLHKDTIAKLQEMVNSGKITAETARGICADFIPESEDDRIRKAIIDFFSNPGRKEYILNGFTVDDIIAWLEKQGEQKHTDTDNKFIRMRETKPKDISEFLNRLTTVEQEFLWEHIEKVKKLDREEREQKPSWNEEDENKVTIFMQLTEGCDNEEELADWLKSLRPQPRWKPSDEQMKALHDLNLTGNISYAGQGQTLIELYNDLKKLREE